MKELREILRRAEQIDDGEAVLATLVDVKGSGYRLPGARMLIDRDGNSLGTLSGGCLEADIVERVKHVLESGEPSLVTYDTTVNENSVFGLGMGCRGVSRVLLEPLRNNPALEFIAHCIDRRERGVMSTLIERQDGGELLHDARFFFTESGELPPPKSQTAAELNEFFENVSWDAKSAMREKRSYCKSYPTTMGRLEFFHEVIDRRTALMIFGAGRDAVPLAELAAELGWHVSLIDHRPARASKDLFPTVDRFIVSRPEDLPTDGFAENGSAAVLMNHNLNMDREILSRLIRSNARYIAVLGPKDRAEKMLAEISEAGPEVTEDQLEKIYAPAGLDIGAPTPSTIALSIVAEIQAVFAGREGGFLRNRQGSIYDR